MRTLDGDDAGGQFLRSALSLAVLTDTSVEVVSVRGGRPEPGLKPQHVAVVDAVAAVCDADVAGARVGSTTVTFEPGRLTTAPIEVDVGTAGSVSLVFDALLPLAARLDEPLSVTATGGTEVAWSPPLVSLARVKLPLLRRHGIAAAVERERTGFYPAGGGRATLHVGPSTPESLTLATRGDGMGVDVVSLASNDLADADVAWRQASAARNRLEDAGLAVCHVTCTDAETESPGSAILVVLNYENARAGFDALGQPGRPAADVGEAAADEALAFHEGTAAVDRHLADQLLVFAAIGGGEVLVPTVTDHVETSVELLSAFGVDVDVSEHGEVTRLAVPEPLTLDDL